MFGKYSLKRRSEIDKLTFHVLKQLAIQPDPSQMTQ
jgi:hypothetical protein